MKNLCIHCMCGFVNIFRSLVQMSFTVSSTQSGGCLMLRNDYRHLCACEHFGMCKQGQREQQQGCRKSMRVQEKSQKTKKRDDFRIHKDAMRHEQVRDNKGLREKLQSRDQNCESEQNWENKKERGGWRSERDTEKCMCVCVRVCVRLSGGKIREAISDCPSMSQCLCPL